MPRLINADVLIEQIKNPYTEYPVMIKIRKAIEDMINETPTVDAEPVRHGRWIWHDVNGVAFYVKECSVCGWTHALNSSYLYCPNCGAKMDEVKEDD